MIRGGFEPPTKWVKNMTRIRTRVLEKYKYLPDHVKVGTRLFFVMTVQFTPRVRIHMEGTVYCFTYVETYLISYHNIYFCEQAI